MQTLSGVVVACLALVALPGVAAAQGSVSTTHKTLAVNVLGGLGGSIDEDGAGYDNLRLQLGASLVTEDTVKVGLRVGNYDFGSNERLGNTFEPELTFVTVAGEYLYGETTYQSGVFVGLGLYRLEGRELFTGNDISTTTIGLTAGVTGEFDISDRFALVGEVSSHMLPSGEAQFFVGGMVGLQFYIK